MDLGDLFAGLSALDVVRVVRRPNGQYDHLEYDSDTVPVTDILNHDAQHTAIGLPEQIVAAIYETLHPLPTIPSPAPDATGVGLTPTLLSAEGVARVYTFADRESTDQAGVTTGTDLIFNTPSDGDVPLNTTTGVFTLKAGVEYELIACPNLSEFTSPNDGFAEYQWVFAATNIPLPSGQAGTAVPLRDTSGKSFQPTAAATYRAVVDTEVKLRVIDSGLGTCSLMANSSWARISTTAVRYIDYTVESSQFQVRKASDQVVVFDSGPEPGLSVAVSPALLAATEYEVRVRHRDLLSMCWTAWSPWQGFTTA